MKSFTADIQYRKFALYGFLKNLRFFDAYILLFFRETGLSFALIGILFSIREVVTNLMEIPSGVIADTFGRRRSMVFCFASYIVSFIMFYLFRGMLLFSAAMVFFALGEAFRTGTHKAMILEYLRQQDMLHLKAEYYGRTRGWSQTGSAISAALAAVMVFYSGDYSMIFLFSVIPYIFGLLLMISYPKELDFSCVQEPCDTGDWKQMLRRSFLSLWDLLSVKALRRGIANSSVYDGIFKAVKDYLQPVIEQLALLLPIMLIFDDRQRSALLIGLVYTVLYLLTSAASRRAGVFRERVGSTEKGMNMLFFIGALTVAAAGVSYILEMPWLSVLAFILYYVVMNIRRPLAVDYMSEHMDPQVMATGLSGESQLKTLATAAAAPLFGLLVDRTGLGEALVFTSAILLFSSMTLRLSAKGQEAAS